MPTSTAWRRRFDSTPRRGASPVRPAADSIERLSPEPPPSTPPPAHAAGRIKRETNGHALQGLGLSHTALSERPIADPDHLYLDSHGRAHLGAKLKSPKHDSSTRHHTSRAPTTHYRGPPKRSHARTASTMSIDDLANIAIATSPQFTANPSFSFAGSPVFHSASRPNTSYINGYSQDSFDRPAKRIKSERLFSAEWAQQDERPRSSYTYQSEVRKEDAELLLSLQNGFSFKAAAAAAASRTLHPSSSESAQQQSLQLPDISLNQSPTIQEETSSLGEMQSPLEESIHTVEQDPNQLQQPGSASSGTEAPILKESDSSTKPEEQALDEQLDEHDKEDYVPSIQAATGTAEQEAPSELKAVLEPAKKSRRIQVETIQPVCPTCNQINSNAREGESTIDWIKCEGSCNRWFHIPCAGFTDQEVKKVAKFICKDCEPEHGPTTFARTSSRARAAPDYAALNEGLTQSNEDATMHHFVPKFKDGTLPYHPDSFARIRPELLTKELWENFDGMKRPFVVPAIWNPRFGESGQTTPNEQEATSTEPEKTYVAYTSDGQVIQESTELPAVTESMQFSREEVIDLDQDYLDMVMPRDLTVRKVAELYGPEEPVPVIDVKTQGIKGKFTLRQWANYYDEKGIKPIRNVISLEVSHSRLGRLIRRPKVVRDIDLEDQVWDAESRANAKKRPVAFYCLMSVGDSYTDFHIDFGGSSVYYHILKGRKTFFFIPPEERYLKKYEEWNMNPEQNQIWLGDHCDGNVTRVDLYPGDTAFIPAGWIHSVWTPEDSLVIGGNFLTRYDLEMQLKVVNIEKINNTPLNYRYPSFQKVMWYTLIKYLEDDPVPENLIREFEDDPDYRYMRAIPVWQEDDTTSADIEPEEEEYNARNYSKSELQGLPALRDFLYRTARIYADLPVGNINKKQIDAVKASIPKGHGDPLQLICLFAVWVAWKRGNEKAVDWVHSDAILQQELDKRDKEKAKKPEVFRVPPERVSARRKNHASNSPAPDRQDTPDTDRANTPSEPNAPYPRIACAACRKKRQACRHWPGTKLEETAQQTLEKTRSYSNVTIDIAKLARASPVVNSIEGPAAPPQPAPPVAQSTPSVEENIPESSNTNIAQEALARMSSQPPEANGATVNGGSTNPGSAKKGRSKACDECRKSKRRCVHDEHGRVDPAKAAEPSKPRGSTSSKRPRLSDEHQSKKVKIEDDYAVFMPNNDIDAMIDPALMDPMLGIQYSDSSMIISDVHALSTPPHTLTTQNSFATPGPFPNSLDPNIDPALMDPALMESSHDVGMTDDTFKLLPSALPKISTAVTGTPDVDKSYSPITAEEASADTTSKRASEEQQQAQPEDSHFPHATEQQQVNLASHIQADEPAGGSAKLSSPPQQQAATPVERQPSDDQVHVSTFEVVQPVSDADTIAVSKSIPVIETDTVKSLVKQEPQMFQTQDYQRADTVASNSSSPEEDASERLARELQAQEHGLRRRPSVRIS